MQINIDASKIDATPSLKKYAISKLGALSKLVLRYEKENGETELFLELSRSTKHHKRGEIFYAEAMMQLPGKGLRAECFDEDIRAAIDKVKDMLRADIAKYKGAFGAKSVRHARGRKSKEKGVY